MSEIKLHDNPENSATRAGFVALIGAPNAGKSTLMNKLVGTKVSIVSHKVQTTRMPVRGIAMEGDSQIVFIDTPGIFKPKRRLDTAMVTSAWGGARDADVIVFLLDVERGIKGDAASILSKLDNEGGRKILLLNKIDTIPREKLFALAEEANAKAKFDDTFMISALNGDGCQDFMKFMADVVPAGPWFYPEDQVSDLPMRVLAAEITREKIYLRLHQELPYSSHVETESWKELPNGIRVEQVIYLQRNSHKKILIGHNGQTLKAISSAARLELCEIMEQPVHLFVFVKVREKWIDDPERYREMGLDFPKN